MDKSDSSDVPKALANQVARVRARIAIPLVVSQPQVQAFFTFFPQNSLTRFVECQELRERMSRSLAFLNAIAAHPSVQSHCNVLSMWLAIIDQNSRQTTQKTQLPDLRQNRQLEY